MQCDIRAFDEQASMCTEMKMRQTLAIDLYETSAMTKADGPSGPLRLRKQCRTWDRLGMDDVGPERYISSVSGMGAVRKHEQMKRIGSTHSWKSRVLMRCS